MATELTEAELAETELTPLIQEREDIDGINETNREWSGLSEKMEEKPNLLTNFAGKESCCIFKVPQSLFNINKEPYEPNIVSIGPYHHNKDHLRMIQEHKAKYLQSILSRTCKTGIGLENFYEAIAEKEKEIRECYSEKIKCERRGLIQMMVLDGCFILELFFIVGLGSLVNPDVDDPIFNLKWLLPFIRRDLLKLENQIPFFVLQILFQLSMTSIQTNLTLTELALNFFSYSVPNRPKEVVDNSKKIEGKHLLDFFRLTFIPPTRDEKHSTTPTQDENHSTPPTQDGTPRLIACTMNLRRDGVKFKSREDGYSFLDVKFSDNGDLEIPRLIIDDFITSFLLNSVAYEQSYYKCSKHMTDYICFMVCLINTPTDASYLTDKNIIQNYFGTDKKVMKFVHKVGKDILFDISKSYLVKVFNGVNKYCESGWHVQWASFKHTYFDTPWSGMSASAALILLLLTIVQSALAILAYFCPP